MVSGASAPHNVFNPIFLSSLILFSSLLPFESRQVLLDVKTQRQMEMGLLLATMGLTCLACH